MIGKGVLFIFLAIILCTPFIAADGALLRTDTSYLAFYDEDAQVAAITYEDGTENLIIAIKTSQIEGSAVWILPIPSVGENIKVDIKDFPRIEGIDLIAMASREERAEELIAAGAFGYLSLPYLVIRRMMFGAVEETVTVYEHVEKEGVIAEVLSAESADALYNYLNSKNISLSKGAIPLVEEYTGKNYSFIASWIEKSNITSRYPAVSINFPIDNIYYPLKLTSLYGERKIPIVIYVAGWAKPETYPEIEPFVEVGYFGPSLSIFQDIQREHYEEGEEYDKRFTNYTVIKVGDAEREEKTPFANKYTEDLQIKKLEKSPVPQIVLKQRIKIDALLLIAIAVCSMITSYIMGKIIFKSGKKFILVGLANCLSWLGLGVALLFIKEEFGKKLKFWLLFPLIFTGVVMALSCITFLVWGIFAGF